MSFPEDPLRQAATGAGSSAKYLGAESYNFISKKNQAQSTSNL